MKFYFKILFALFVVLNVCCAPSNLIYYKNSSYFNASNNFKKLYLFPISSVKFEKAAREYTEYHLLKDPLTIEDNFLRHFNTEYIKIAKKNVNKNKITLVDSIFAIEYSMEDTNQVESKEIYDKEKENLFRVKIPKKKIIDSLRIGCNYALFITDVKLLQTRYYVPIFFPLPGGFIAGNTTGPAFGIYGKYILWDYDKECAICAGNFKKNFLTMSIGNNYDKDRIKPVIISILNNTPFWKIY